MDKLWNYINLVKQTDGADDAITQIVNMIKEQRSNIRDKSYSPNLTRIIVETVIAVAVMVISEQRMGSDGR